MRLRVAVMLTSVVALVLMTGCEHTAALHWAPDGSRATFVGADGLHLVDPTGAISLQPFCPRSDSVGLFDRDALPAVEWMPDSKHVLVARTQEVSSWNEITAVISPERASYLVTQAQVLERELLELKIPEDGEVDFNIDHSAVQVASSDELLAVLFYLWGHRTPELTKVFAALDKKNEVPFTHGRIYVLELCDAVGLELSTPRELVRTLDRIQDIRVSPDGQYLLYTAGDVPTKEVKEYHDVSYYHLFLLPLKDAVKPKLIAKGAAISPDWAGDSRRIAYIRANTPELVGREKLQLGAISRAKVRDENGGLLAQPEIEDLAGLVFYDQARVRWLRDGRILFSGAEIHLPCTAKEMPARQSLFMLDPERQAVVTSVVPRAVQEHIGDAVQIFEPSPDQTRVLIPDAGENNTIVSLKTGELILLPASPKDLRLTPAWRTNDELSLVVPVNAKPGRDAEVKLWNLTTKSGTDISANWPNAAIKDLLIPGGSQKTQK